MGDQLKDHDNNHLLNAVRHTKCPICGKVFNKAKLTPHIKQVHTDVAEAIECPKCGKRFREARYVRKHIKDVHSKEENKCGDCPKTFSQLRYLNIHIRNEHSKTESIGVDEQNPNDSGENNVQTDALDLSISLSSHSGEGLAFVEIKEEALDLVKEEEPDGKQIAEPKVNPGDLLEQIADETPCDNAESE